MHTSLYVCMYNKIKWKIIIKYNLGEGLGPKGLGPLPFFQYIYMQRVHLLDNIVESYGIHIKVKKKKIGLLIFTIFIDAAKVKQKILMRNLPYTYSNINILDNQPLLIILFLIPRRRGKTVLVVGQSRRSAWAPSL